MARVYSRPTERSIPKTVEVHGHTRNWSQQMLDQRRFDPSQPKPNEIDDLPWRVVVLRCFGLSYDEIGRRFGYPHTWVRTVESETLKTLAAIARRSAT